MVINVGIERLIRPQIAALGAYVASKSPDALKEEIEMAPGDIIRGINDLSFTKKKDFKEAIIRYRLKEKITVLIQRGWRVYSISFKM